MIYKNILMDILSERGQISSEKALNLIDFCY